MSDLLWSLDSLSLRDNILFGFGWVFHVRDDVRSVGVRLHYKGEKGSPGELFHGDVGKPRADIARGFPNVPRALNSGFVIFCAFPAGVRLDSVSLEVQLSSGVIATLPIPQSRVADFGSHDERGFRSILAQLSIFLKRGLHLIREGQFVSLLSKVRRYVGGRPNRALQSPADLVRELEVNSQGKISLIIDHDLGGGANHYRDRLVASKLESGETVLIYSYHVATLTYMLIVQSYRLNFRYSIKAESILLDLVRQLSLDEIIYNTAVSFARPEEIPQLLVSLKRITAAPLKVFVHDFFMVCPSHFLLDHTGTYCQIPDVEICARCLPINQQGLSSLFTERDIKKWRAIWGAMLTSADNIVAFSTDTVRLLRKAYPQIEESQLSVVPHVVEHLSGKVPIITNTATLCIGVVGQIGVHKGASVIQAIAQEIKRRAVDIKIVVIGVIETACEPSVVRQTGPYRHDELPCLIESAGVNVMLFPSVWPETFSYVVQELMEMQLPVVSFNFGAPAERLACYSKGLVLDSLDPSSVLDQLSALHRKLYLTH